nr:hypothetical protein [Bacteroides fragilis]
MYPKNANGCHDNAKCCHAPDKRWTLPVIPFTLRHNHN